VARLHSFREHDIPTRADFFRIHFANADGAGIRSVLRLRYTIIDWAVPGMSSQGFFIAERGYIIFQFVIIPGLHALRLRGSQRGHQSGKAGIFSRRQRCDLLLHVLENTPTKGRGSEANSNRSSARIPEREHCSAIPESELLRKYSSLWHLRVRAWTPTRQPAWRPALLFRSRLPSYILS